MDLMDWVRDALHVLNVWHREMITILKVPTPLKIVKTLTVLPDGCIGSGLDDMSYPETIWECPMSHEAWVHVINITSPAYTPTNPLTAGEIMLLGSHGEIIVWAPEPDADVTVIPANLIREGRFSAPHLNAGEALQVVGDLLPPGIAVRFDLQINLVSGISPDTPIPNIGTTQTTSNNTGA